MKRTQLSIGQNELVMCQTADSTPLLIDISSLSNELPSRIPYENDVGRLHIRRGDDIESREYEGQANRALKSFWN